jgi:hypothetical protein
VADEARRAGKKAHVGLIFTICVEKGSELPVGDPNRKFKGRVVCQGNNVRDEQWQTALFNDMNSAPASMQAAKACDAFGLLPGHVTEQCDAEAAYIQSKLAGDTPTWVRLPRDQWPKAWSGLRDPVCPLVLALYGHPDAGGYWEKHCESHLRSVGFEPVTEWRSCFFHPRLHLFLTVYVDDFKMSGPANVMSAGWALIRKHIRTETPTPVGKYLGCEHVSFACPDGSGGVVRQSLLTLPAPPLPVTTGSARGVSAAAKSGNHGSGSDSIRGITWDMSAFLRQCVALYQELGGVKAKNLKMAPTPFIDVAVEAMDEKDTSGELAPVASRILMKILYAARMARYDLLRATCFLATRITKWNEACDRLLYRLVCYINSTLNLFMTGWIGDKPDDLELVLYTDADFVSDESARSTTGVFLCLKGPNSFVPLSAFSKRQSCVSHSTPEAEIVAADAGLRVEGIPAAGLWEVLLGRQVTIRFLEDNTSAISVLRTGRNPAMRHMGRTHRVDIMFLHECLESGHYTARTLRDHPHGRGYLHQGLRQCG